MPKASAAAIAAKLAGHPVRPHGRNYVIQCPAHDDQNPSLSIRDGDDGRLIVHCFAGCDPLDVLSEIRARIGNIREHVETSPKPAKGSSAYERGQHEKARWFWSQRLPIAGSIAERYLREGRGITCPLASTLAFLPALKREHHQAMISAFGIYDEVEPGIIAAPREVVAIHLTLLKPDGTGKAEVEPNKQMIGSPGGKPIIVAPPNDSLGLAITEGIEDALSIHEATGLGAWAAGSATRMTALAEVVPDYADCVSIFADTDAAGLNNSALLAERLAARGIHVEIIPSARTDA
jgi:hypothetical protein